MPRPTHHQVNYGDIESSLMDNSIIIYCFMQLFDPGSSVSPKITLAKTSEISVQYLHALLGHSEAVSDTRNRLILFQNSQSALETIATAKTIAVKSVSGSIWHWHVLMAAS